MRCPSISQSGGTPQSPYPPWAFNKDDRGDDRWFYAQPRLVVHLDEPAIGAVGRYFAEALPRDSHLLDLMSSWRTHLPDEFVAERVVGLGMNAVEMMENPQLHDMVVHDLNVSPALPFEDGEFDACVVTVSIQYLTTPLEVFAEVNRVLRPGGGFHVIYSNRMFFTKAVAIWKSMDDDGRGLLVGTYFESSGGWTPSERLDISPGAGTDPVFVVRAFKM